MATNFIKKTGDLAQTSIGGASLTIAGCTTTTGSPVIPTTGALAGVAAGQAVSGTGIPVGATILSVGTQTFTISANATASGTVSVTATGEVQVVGLMDWEMTINLDKPAATTTDDAAWKSYLPSSKDWTVTSKYCYYQGDPSQRAAILSTINAPGTIVRWNFFIDAAGGDDAFYGNAFLSSAKFGAGVGKIVGYDISLQGTGPCTYSTQIAPVVNTNTNTGLQAEV